MQLEAPEALYIHVPFCPSICPYCDFHKMRRNEALVQRYVTRLIEEAQGLYQRYPHKLKTIYWGGGTPGHLNDAELTRLFSALDSLWGLPSLELSFEADPLSFDRERLVFFKDLGISRLSIGLQSTQDEVLRFLGRGHSAKEGLDAARLALEAGFEVSVDIISSVPQQDIYQDIDAILELAPQHISSYSLSIEAHTPFALRQIVVDEEQDYEDYLALQESLARADYESYEISNYARPGHRSQHNQVYWRGDAYLALGPSASGFLCDDGQGPIRYKNPNIRFWLERQAPEIERIDHEAYLFECLMTGLRTVEGVELGGLERKLGFNPMDILQDKVDRYCQQGLLIYDKGYLSASFEGKLKLNGVLLGLLDALNNV